MIIVGRAGQKGPDDVVEGEPSLLSRQRRISPVRAENLSRGRRTSAEAELEPEIADEIGLIGTGRFEAASRHEKKDDGFMDFIASAQPKGGFVGRGMEGALRIELRIHFKF
jgi:hypothetical protein